MFTIEKNVPIPNTRGGGKKELRLTMEKLEVGDSFLITERRHRQQVHQVAQAIGIKYATRTICKDSGEIRVWRTE